MTALFEVLSAKIKVISFENTHDFRTRRDNASLAALKLKAYCSPVLLYITIFASPLFSVFDFTGGTVQIPVLHLHDWNGSPHQGFHIAMVNIRVISPA